MPHVVIKLWPGRGEELKRNLAEKVAELVARELHADIGDMSVAFEEIPQKDWGTQIYKKEIKDHENIYFKPAYKYN